MKPLEIHLGKTYLANVRGRLLPVKVLSIASEAGKTRYLCQNQRSWRNVILRAGAFSEEIKPREATA